MACVILFLYIHRFKPPCCYCILKKKVHSLYSMFQKEPTCVQSINLNESVVFTSQKKLALLKKGFILQVAGQDNLRIKK